MKKKRKYLITGTSSGLGKYLLEEIGGEAFIRNNHNALISNQNRHFFGIIHCATDARNFVLSNELINYYQSHIELTKNLLSIPHDHFIFISSVEVYAEQFLLNSESDVHRVPSYPVRNETNLLYGVFKLLAEKIVQEKSNKALILRPTSIVGRTMRKNNIQKLLSNSQQPISLHPDSSYNLVSMQQIKDFIKLSMDKNISGIFNIGANDNASLKEIAKFIGGEPKFGDHIHNVKRINTNKILQYSKMFDKSTLDIAQKVAAELKTLQNQ
ncbi:hypothetical protein DSCO28_03220 [Desulfosarcina ovata subsp. sediminis]|uniref:dTDP-4-dehydrorhamnose reductase n=1 Tax=Desulfosarcina ovata subsp. sediminis TaxID=885957 RepID=A0A5K7ZFL6_9BACT|nr:NAD-dependent epimerase/dehydratase family protein [Desulfosarcina ovata]BBO79756.1 hypothetical protein DSCO28_03220 [Desulfosarcina ovata subsp. sediminis]